VARHARPAPVRFCAPKRDMAEAVVRCSATNACRPLSNSEALSLHSRAYNIFRAARPRASCSNDARLIHVAPAAAPRRACFLHSFSFRRRARLPCHAFDIPCASASERNTRRYAIAVRAEEWRAQREDMQRGNANAAAALFGCR